MTLPNLAGVASKNLVESIGTGKYSASYINWSRTMNLLHEHAPGWMVDYVPNAEGGLLHRAPNGGYLLIGFRHIDGATTPALPQAVMDNRNNAIAYDKISARDITDTQRRGMCMAAAMTFGLAYELWAKMPLESGYGGSEAPAEAPKAAPKAAAAKEVTEATFREAALDLGIHTEAIDKICELVKGKGGDWAGGIALLKGKPASEWNAKYAPAESGGEEW